MTASLCASSSFRGSKGTEKLSSSTEPPDSIGSYAIHCKPKAFAFLATTLPILPKPTMPRDLPKNSWYEEKRGRGHSPFKVEIVAGMNPLINATAAPTTYSATDSAFAPVAGITLILRFAHAGNSIFSRPTPSLPTTLKFGAPSNISSFT